MKDNFNKVYNEIITEEKKLLNEGLFGLFNKSNKQPKQEKPVERPEEKQTSSKSGMPKILVDNMPMEQWNDILEDMKKAAADCKTKEIGDALGMDVLLLKRGKVSNQSEGSQGSYDPKKMTILKSVHPQSFKDMIEDIKKAAEICTDKELKDALKMDLAILKENI